jgi:hypothetical protein
MTRSGGVSGQISANNVAFTVLATEGKTYLKLTAAALKTVGAPAVACVLVCGKWLLLPAKAASGMLGSFGWSSMFDNANLGSLPHWSYAGKAGVNGQPAWKMKLAKGQGYAYVAATARPYLLRIVTPGYGTTDFTQWNTAVIPPAPPAGQVVDLSQLMKG